MVVWPKYDLSWNIIFPFIYLSNINKEWSINLKINQHNVKKQTIYSIGSDNPIYISYRFLLPFYLHLILGHPTNLYQFLPLFIFGHSRTSKLFVNFSTDDFWDIGHIQMLINGTNLQIHFSLIRFTTQNPSSKISFKMKWAIYCCFEWYDLHVT